VIVCAGLVKRLDPVAFAPSQAYTDALRVTFAPQFPISKEKLFSGPEPAATVIVCPYVAVLGTPKEEIKLLPFQLGIVLIA
jgi:hypothetical protein